ncbi:MAG: DUF6526 family protein [Acidobacteriota bacterium]
MGDVQNYQNHTRWLPAFHFFAVPVLLINVIYELRNLYMAPSAATAFAVVVAAAILTVCFLSRTQALTAQDRLIRLEMRLRLQRVLGPDLQGRINELSVSQMVALRFASDGELPDLVRAALEDNLSPKDIKKAIKQWEPDLVRV